MPTHDDHGPGFGAQDRELAARVSAPTQAPSGAGTSRWGDAVSPAASDIAAPRRHFLAGLRDSHAEALLRIASLRRCLGVVAGRDTPIHLILAHLLDEAQEQLHRLEILFARLRERPGAGLVQPGGTDLPGLLARTGFDDVAPLLLALAAMERSGAEDAQRLRRLASTAGQNLAARLLDLTVAERDAAARLLVALLERHGPEGGAIHH
jgi:hypothetical protein